MGSWIGTVFPLLPVDSLCVPFNYRFDIMWLLLDEHDEANDKRLAAHIIAVHQGRVGAPASAAEGAAAGGQAGSSRQQQRRQQEGASTSGVSDSYGRHAKNLCVGWVALTQSKPTAICLPSHPPRPSDSQDARLRAGQGSCEAGHPDVALLVLTGLLLLPYVPLLTIKRNLVHHLCMCHGFQSSSGPCDPMCACIASCAAGIRPGAHLPPSAACLHQLGKAPAAHHPQGAD
jgi:hypothetical protein